MGQSRTGAGADPRPTLDSVTRVQPTISGQPQNQPTAPESGSDAGSLTDRVRRVLEMIRPAVQADGGDLELVDITPESLVRIRLHGACVGCPSSNVTLQMGIERNLREYVPEIKGVISIEDP